ncbi:uncharacterized protein [Periplaneta americana]|uniref:uncharacterized protein isoform X2 n=1 Tax=Periplaneta americana TaxID=6978 RepID=UPI0037E77051
MQIAAEQDSHYVFEATEWPNGHYVGTHHSRLQGGAILLLLAAEPASPPGNNFVTPVGFPDGSFGDVFTTTEVVLGLGPRRLSSVRDLNCGSGNSAGTFTASAKLQPSTATTLPPTAVASADSNLTVEGTTPRQNPKGDDLATVTYTLWVGTNVTEFHHQCDS